MDWIPFTSCDGARVGVGVVVGPLPILGHEGLGTRASHANRHRSISTGPSTAELEVEEGDHLAVPQRVHQREVAVVDDLLDERARLGSSRR